MATISFIADSIAVSITGTANLRNIRFTGEPAASGDDGFARTNGSEFNNSAGNLYFGNGSAGSYQYRTFIRLLLNIPPGATINAAFFKFVCNTTQAVGNFNCKIYCEDVDASSQPSDGSDLINATNHPLTSASTTWDTQEDWTAGGTYYSPDFASALQEVVDRSGFEQNNAITVHIISNNTYAYQRRFPRSYDYGSDEPQIQVDYTDPPPVIEADISATTAVSKARLGNQLFFIADCSAITNTANLYLSGATEQISIYPDGIGLNDSIIAAGGSQEVLTPADTAGLDDSINAYCEFDVATPADTAGLGDSIDAINTTSPISDAAGLGDYIAGGLETQHTLSDGAAFGDAIDALNWSQFLRDNQSQYVIRYFCTLTGAADLTTDFEIPISAFSARKRDGEATYLQVTVPGIEYSEQITDRSNGQLLIEMAYFVGGTEQLREEILRVDLETIRIDEGARNRSITLSGHRIESYGNNEIELTDATYKYVSDGIRRYRFAIPDPWLNPGDTAIIGDDSFRVGYITYNISTRYRQMEITEA